LQITVFFLPPAAAVPLHNHPGMTVFSKLLVGSAHVVSYDWVHPRVCAAGSEPRTTTTMLTEKVLDDRFTAASSARALFPDAGGNLHRFVAGEEEPCAFLDVITPPYSPASEAHAQQRFAYYQEFPFELHHPSRVRIYYRCEN
jgi:cysteamine dioxygenase